ncbi:UNVERIFIED_CONTAM: hypothetical protein FKN15_048116 [Acipenser sinensis]
MGSNYRGPVHGNVQQGVLGQSVEESLWGSESRRWCAPSTVQHRVSVHRALQTMRALDVVSTGHHVHSVHRAPSALSTTCTKHSAQQGAEVLRAMRASRYWSTGEQLCYGAYPNHVVTHLLLIQESGKPAFSTNAGELQSTQEALSYQHAQLNTEVLPYRLEKWLPQDDSFNPSGAEIITSCIPDRAEVKISYSCERAKITIFCVSERAKITISCVPERAKIVSCVTE